MTSLLHLESTRNGNNRIRKSPESLQSVKFKEQLEQISQIDAHFSVRHSISQNSVSPCRRSLTGWVANGVDPILRYTGVCVGQNVSESFLNLYLLPM